MIIVQLAGGIGNQMFQYACGKALACKHATALTLDHSLLEDRTPRRNFTYRSYALGIFGINLFLPPEQLAILLTSHKIVEEKNFPPTDAVLESSGKLYLRGYFQDERYFVSVADIVRKDFSFPETISTENAKFFAALREKETPVSIHIRRGDYLAAGNRKFFAVCQEDYYRQAVDIITVNVANPTFFIFSVDDPEWARNIFTRLNIDFVLVENAASEHYAHEDMHMMSLCRHNIIANSSFSWWGAWLNPNPHKIVIGPKSWYVAKEYQNINPCPPEWRRL
jgi:hypothetical protein